jgi:hypothetical protein
MPTITKSLAYADYIQGIQSLTPEEQLNLLEVISVNLKKTWEHKRAKHSIMELEGLGAEIWQGIDAQDYVRKERESWD